MKHLLTNYFTIASLVLLTTNAVADEGMIEVVAPTPVVTTDNPPPPPEDDVPLPIDEPAPGTGGRCGPHDPTCSQRIGRILNGIHLAPVEVSGGARFGENGAQGAIRFSTRAVGMDTAVGDFNAILFDAIYLPDAGGFRIRFTLADSEVLFFCKDKSGRTHFPFGELIGGIISENSGISENCEPTGVVGVGGTITQVQWDSVTHRIGARWLELNLVLNFLRNGTAPEYLRRRLNAYVGGSVDTIWYNGTPNTTDSRHTMARGNLGISGMIRSENNHWEINGLAGYRPNIAAWDDFSIETRTRILYHFLMTRHPSPSGNGVVGDIGLDAQYQYNSVPAHSFGEYASDRDRNSAYLGVIFGVNWVL